MIHVSLYENDTSEKLWEMLPAEYQMMNLYGREMCCRLGNGSLPVKNVKRKEYQTGDIAYRPAAGSLVILYEQNGEEFEQVTIGHTDEDLSFFYGMNDRKMTFAREE